MVAFYSAITPLSWANQRVRKIASSQNSWAVRLPPFLGSLSTSAYFKFMSSTSYYYILICTYFRIDQELFVLMLCYFSLAISVIESLSV
jgi:hypothetical protein